MEPYFQVKKAPNEYGGAKPISEGASFDTVLFMTFQYECSGTTGFLGGGKPKCGKNTKGVQIHRLETFELPVKQTKWEKNVLTCKIDNKKAKLTLLGGGELKFNQLPSGLQKRVKKFGAEYPVTAVYVKTKNQHLGDQLEQQVGQFYKLSSFSIEILGINGYRSRQTMRGRSVRRY